MVINVTKCHVTSIVMDTGSEGVKSGTAVEYMFYQHTAVTQFMEKWCVRGLLSTGEMD